MAWRYLRRGHTSLEPLGPGHLWSRVVEWPTFNELARIAPTSVICVALIYFGWWLRGAEVKHLLAWIEELRK